MLLHTIGQTLAVHGLTEKIDRKILGVPIKYRTKIQVACLFESPLKTKPIIISALWKMPFGHAVDGGKN